MREPELRLPHTGVPLLAPWGVSYEADLVYRTLVECGPQSLDDLRRALGLPARRVRVALDELGGAHAVHLMPSQNGNGGRPDARRWRPTATDTVVATLRRRGLSPAARETRRLADLIGPGLDLPDALDRPAAGRTLDGVDRVRSRLAELSRTARVEHLSMHPEPTFSAAAVKAATEPDHDVVDRGIAVWSLGVPPGGGDATAAHTAQLVNRGLEYRELPALPAKMFVFDRRTAIIPIDPSNLRRGALELTEPTVVRDLVAWFLRHWFRATAPGPTAPFDVTLTDRERRLVDLLDAGHTDATAATRLGVSQRTVTHVLRGLMDRLHVQNRFQLGLVLGAGRTVLRENS